MQMHLLYELMDIKSSEGTPVKTFLTFKCICHAQPLTRVVGHLCSIADTSLLNGESKRMRKGFHAHAIPTPVHPPYGAAWQLGPEC